MSESGIGIATRELGFAYRGHRVLEGVDLTAGPGEVVGLVGPNGSGKSTTIRILSGVLKNYRGSVRVGDRELGELSPRELARRMAVVPQEPRISFPFSALEIVLMGRHPHLAGLEFESPADLALAHEALERCGVAELAGRPVQQLSSGERQRVIFAKALAQEPGILLLDEPASFLDIRHQVELYDVVRDLARNRGCAVLTVLHDLNLAAEYCDRITLLHDGRVEADGPPADVLTYSNLRRVFRTDVYIDTNSVTGNLLVVPLAGRPGDR